MSAVGFLEPVFLWALSFLAAVLLIHLLRRPRTVRLAFSTLRFFGDAAVAADRSRKLRRLLLLLVRLLAAAVIVVLFARPYAARDPLRNIVDPSRELFVWIDPSPSMGYRVDGAELYRHAEALLDSIALLRPGGAGIRVFDREREEFIPYSQFRQAPFRMTFVSDLAALGAACEGTVQDAKNAVVLFFSDFQAHDTGALCALRKSGIPGGIPVIGIALTPEHPWNAAVRDLQVSAAGGGALEVAIAAFGERGADGGFTVTLGTMRTAQQSFSLPAGADTVIPVPVRTTASAAWGNVRLRCNDPLAFDNNAWFTVNTPEACSVLIIGDEAVNFPIAAALRSADTVRWKNVVRMFPERVTFNDVASADLVILNGCRENVPALTVLQKGRGTKEQAFIVAGTADTAADPVWLQFGRSRDKTGGMMHAKAPLAAELPDTVTGLWHDFPALLSSEVRIYSYRTGLQGTVLLSLTGGAALATAADDAVGRRWVYCATPLGISEANNLCETGFYVPCVDRLSRFACAKLVSRDERWIAGRQVRNRWYAGALPARIFDAAGTRQLLRLQQQKTFVIETPGVYKIVPPGAPPYLKTVVPDSLESECRYHIPIPKDDTACGRWTMVKPRELVNYLGGHNRMYGWVIPWVLLVVLLAGELLLRESNVGFPGGSKKDKR